MIKRLLSKWVNGQSYVELSVILTVLIILFGGVVDFGRAYLIYLELRDAAQEGASYGSYSPSDLIGIETRARETMKDPIDLSDPTIVQVLPSLSNPSYACSGFDPISLEPNEIKVVIKYEMPIGMPFLGTVLDTQEITLVATAANAILAPPCE